MRRLLVKIRFLVSTMAVASLIAVPAAFSQTASSKISDPPSASSSAPASAPAPVGGATMRVAVLNVRGAIVNTAEGKQAAAEMQSQLAPGQAQMDDLRKKIEDTEKRIQTGSTTLSDEERGRLDRQDQLYQNQARRLQDQISEEMQAYQADVFDRISRKMDDILRKYAGENGYSAVIDSSSQAIVFVAPGADITEAIVKLYDQAYPVKASTTPAKPNTTPPATPKKQPGQQQQ
jgi:Skp family chaperone for outer membrane proteins